MTINYKKFESIKTVSTNINGTINKYLFMYLIGCNFDQEVKSTTDKKEINKLIRNTLGNGYSLTSCIQAIPGEKAQEAFREFKKEYHSFVREHMFKLIPKP